MAEELVALGMAEVVALYGEPQVRCYDLGDWGDLQPFWDMWEKREGEAILVIWRPDGRIVLQTKRYYPAGAYRLPTGGICPGERLLDAVRREMREETGQPGRTVRFLAVLRYCFRRHGEPLQRASYAFLVRVDSGDLRPEDETEQISAFRHVLPEELPAVATQLEQLSGRWAEWGRFRALAHRLVAQLLSGGEA